MHADTDPAVEQIVFKFCREAPAWRKLKMAGELTEAMLLLSKSGLRNRYPKASPEQIRRLLADQILGPELAVKVYGPLNVDM